MKGSSGMDLEPGIDRASRTRSLPTTEEVAANVTDPLLEAMGPTAQGLGRYQPQTPWGSAANFGTNMLLDPTELVGPGLGKAGKLFRTMR